MMGPSQNADCNDEDMSNNNIVKCCVSDPNWGPVDRSTTASTPDAGITDPDGGVIEFDGGAEFIDDRLPWCTESGADLPQADEALDSNTTQRCCPSEEQWQNHSSN